MELIPQKAVNNGIYEVIGYNTGPSTEAVRRSAKFKVLKIAPAPGYVRTERFVRLNSIAIEPMCALPSYCPWIEYVLTVEKMQNSPLFNVLDVKNCRPRDVKKRELLDYIVKSQYSPSESSDPEAFRGFLRRETKLVPKKIRFGDDIAHITDASLESQVRTVLIPRFKNDVFFRLLTFFASGFLLQFDERQLEVLFYILRTKPYIFCFWNLTTRSLCDVSTDDGGKMFSHSELKVSPKYPYTHGDKLAKAEPSPVWYTKTGPMLSAKAVEKACEIEGAQPACDIKDLRDAQSMYITTRKFFYARGRYCCYSPRDSELNRTALKFLIDNQILRFAMGDRGRKKLLIDHNDEMVELNFASFLDSHVARMEIFDCPYYNKEFVRRFSDWYGKLASKKACYEIVLVGANSSVASYMSSNTGLDFVGAGNIDVAGPGWKKRSRKRRKLSRGGGEGEGERILAIVVDRAHKLGPDRMLQALRNISRQERHVGASIMLYLFGDLNEHGAHHLMGGGRLLSDIADSRICTVNRWTAWAPDDPMVLVYDCICKKAPADLTMFCLKDTKLDLLEKLSEIYKTKKRVRGTRIIFCSTEKDRATTADAVIRIHDRSPNRAHFYVGQRIQVLQTDTIGQIDRAWCGGKEVAKKEAIDIGNRQYVLSVTGKQIDTAGSTIERADISMISKYAGPPLRDGVFVVGDSTTTKDLKSAAKYCQQSLRLLFFPGTSLGRMLTAANDPEPTDLRTKLVALNKTF